MSQHYSDPDREHEPYALPDVEVFFMSAEDFRNADEDTWMYQLAVEYESLDLGPTDLAGWYYWYCFPGCLPDSDPYGPYNTEQEAVDAAQEDAE